MDIRNFFGKAGASAKTKRKGSAAPTTSSTSSSSSGPARSAPSAGAGSNKKKPKGGTPSPSSSSGGGRVKDKKMNTKSKGSQKEKKTTTKKAPIVLDDDTSDTDATTDELLEEEPAAPSSSSSRRSEKSRPAPDDDGSATTTDDATPPSKRKQEKKETTAPSPSGGSNKKRKNAAEEDDGTSGGSRVEISAADFFGGGASSDAKATTTKKKQKCDSTSSDSKKKKKKLSALEDSSEVEGVKDDDDAAVDDDDDNDGDEDYVDDEEEHPPDEKSDDFGDDDSDDEDFEVSRRSSKKKKKGAAKEEKNSSRSRHFKRKVVDEDDDDEDDVDFESKPSPPKRTATSDRDDSPRSIEKKASSPSPKTAMPKAKASSSSSAKKKSKTPKKPPRGPPVKPTESIPSYPTDEVTPGCLDGLAFVFTGILPDLHRDDATDYVKILGGRVTAAVSGKTDYLVCGSELEDGREVEEGSKYRKAKELGESSVVILRGEGELYGLVKTLDERLKGDDDKGQEGDRESSVAEADSAGAKVAAAASNNPYMKKNNPYAKASNPYAKRPAANPYAKKSNPYTSIKDAKPSSPPAADRGAPQMGGGRADVNDANALWADKYAPSATRDILGNQEAVRKLSNWLSKWEGTFNNARAQGKSYGSPNGPWKAALLSGPPGIGKTTTALLVAKESGRDVLELNASDTRSKKGLSQGLGDVTGSQVLSFAPKGGQNRKKGSGSSSQKRCIIMDEVDGMGAGDRSGMAELIKMIKASKVPIICICNDRQSQKVKSLVPYCLDLRYRRPVKTVIARRAVEVGKMEGMRVEPNAAEAIAESCGNDIRQVLNCLQMWSSKKRESSNVSTDMTYKDVKERQGFINKDEILRLSMFDATKMIVEGSRGLAGADAKAVNDSIFKRSDAFFTDYSLMGLNVHQNYLKVMIGQFQETKRKSDADAELKCIDRMYEATESMSDFAVAENIVRGGDMNWGLLPLCAMLTVKAGHHAGGDNGGFLPGFPEFAGWLGKNSSRGRKARLLRELGHHMNYRVSADSAELRFWYVPALRERFLKLMTDKDGAKTEEVIQLMDEYGLDRDDLFENIDEFTLDGKAMKFANLDSKTKAAFTREYNKGIHKSQALVAEQGASKMRRKASDVSVKDPEDLDAVNDDRNQQEEEDVEEDMDTAAIESLFKKKGRAAGKAKKASTAKGRKGKKK